jgi:hypothetical protein
MQVGLKTPQVAKLLGRSSWWLSSLLRSGKLNPPAERDSSGHYLWSPADIDAARVAMAIDRRYGKREVKHVKS